MTDNQTSKNTVTQYMLGIFTHVTVALYYQFVFREDDEREKGLDENTILTSILNSGHYDISLEDQEAMKSVLAYLERSTETTVQISKPLLKHMLVLYLLLSPSSDEMVI